MPRLRTCAEQGRARRGAAVAPWRGRLWAVRGQPTATNDDQRQPPDCWSEGPRVKFSKVRRIMHHSLRNKKQEWEEYRSEVTAFELRKMLPVL